MEAILSTTAHFPEHTSGDPFLNGNAISPIISPLSATELYLSEQAGRHLIVETGLAYHNLLQGISNENV